MNTESVLTLMPASKEEIKQFGTNIINSVLDGNINPLDLDARLKHIEELLKYVRKNDDLRDMVSEEAHKFGKSFEYANCKIQIASRKTYDYSADSEWLRISKEIEELKSKLKERETFLKSIKYPIFDSITGEEIHPIPFKEVEQIRYTIK